MMRRALMFALVIVQMISFTWAKAENNLSDMTYDELVSLREQINAAVLECEEWQEVEVPQGVWKVGVDIPVGHWTIRCAPEWRKTEINWGEFLSDSGENINWKGRYSVYNSVYNPAHKYYEVGDGIIEYDFVAKDGSYIVIDEGAALFMPYTGKVPFDFK